jgi:3',5'-cyclic AMP phosphodiesterase CpdA
MIGPGVEAVLPLGDTQYETGARDDYRASYHPTWGKFRDRSYPVVGNHEYLTRGAAGYFGYFGERAHGPRGYYAYNLGRWRMYALNNQCPQISCQTERRWLRRDLREHPRRCTLAAMHHPRFSSGEQGNSPTRAGFFWPLLDRHQVDVVLAGHDHVYERFARMTNAGHVSRDGIQSWVVGTGGKSLRTFTMVHNGSRARSNERAGVLFMRLRPRSYTWRYRTIDGETRDAGRARCVI